MGSRVAGKLKSTLSESFAYGVGGVGDLVPPRATLLFELERLGVQWPGRSSFWALYKAIPGIKRKVYWSQQ